jgi:hypothetical protein
MRDWINKQYLFFHLDHLVKRNIQINQRLAEAILLGMA